MWLNHDQLLRLHTMCRAIKLIDTTAHTTLLSLVPLPHHPQGCERYYIKLGHVGEPKGKCTHTTARPARMLPRLAMAQCPHTPVSARLLAPVNAAQAVGLRLAAASLASTRAAGKHRGAHCRVGLATALRRRLAGRCDRLACYRPPPPTTRSHLANFLKDEPTHCACTNVQDPCHAGRARICLTQRAGC